MSDGLKLAIAEVNRLRDLLDAKDAEIEKLRAALKPFADEAERHNRLCLGPDIDHWSIDVSRLTLGDLRAAAAALKETGDE